jgi:hypothetical protein
MSQFLDILRARLADAQQRLQIAQANLVRVQTEHQAVMQEYGSWQNAVAVETRREAQEQAQIQASERVLAGGSPPTPVPHLAVPLVAPGSEINKVHLIRDVLRQHPNGITPADVWREVKDHVGRAYVYSVLKRLKDRKQVAERRGKYFLQITPKPEETKEPNHVN